MSKKYELKKTKQLSLSDLLGCPEIKRQEPAVKKMNPIYLDSSEEDDGEEKEKKKKKKKKNNGGINTTTRISVKKYLFDDVSKSPLAALTPKKLKPFNTQSKENSTYLNRLEHSYSPIKIDLDSIDALCQKTMENLENSIAKCVK
uniref:Uncharacterized protein n=1 Tax=Glossina morsitans morsitans TaxID=37546 RepID=A0A1B0GCZ2_GLOMM